MTEIREECRYTKTHEWVKVEGDIATCGIGDYAQSQTGELVFVELPELDEEVSAGDDICVIESVKSASDVYTPISGVVVAVNDALVDSPSIVNDSCYDDGWLFKIKMSEPNEFDDLLGSQEYAQEIAEA